MHQRYLLHRRCQNRKTHWDRLERHRRCFQHRRHRSQMFHWNFRGIHRCCLRFHLHQCRTIHLGLKGISPPNRCNRLHQSQGIRPGLSSNCQLHHLDNRPSRLGFRRHRLIGHGRNVSESRIHCTYPDAFFTDHTVRSTTSASPPSLPSPVGVVNDEG